MPETRQPCRSRRLMAMLAVASTMALLVPLSVPGQAAVRRCFGAIIASGEHPHSEQEARRSALAAWEATAARLGPGYTRWQLAVGHRIACERRPSGGHLCRAMGAPCTIEQAPKPSPRRGIDT